MLRARFRPAPRLRRAAPAAVLLAAVAVGGTACEAGPFGNHQQDGHYATGAKAHDAHKSMPDWIPDDATDIAYRMRTTNSDHIVKASLPNGKLPGFCRKQDGRALPDLHDSWWPKHLSAHDGAYRCHGDTVQLKGNTAYGWYRDPNQPDKDDDA